jgi:hypothetical protein
MKNNYKDRAKVGDYVIFCDICGTKEWFSKSKIQAKYTGSEGAVVCRDCVDLPSGLLMPFRLPPEKTPKIVTHNHYSSNPEDLPDAPTINFDTSPPTVED